MNAMKWAWMRWWMGVCVALGVMAQAGGQTLTREQVQEILGKTTMIRSADGLTVVTSEGLLSGADSLQLCQFATDVRRRMAKLLNVPLEGREMSAEIRVMEAPEEGKTAVSWRVGGPGVARILVVIRGVDTVDPERVTCALASAYLRADALAHGWKDEEESLKGDAEPYPLWFGKGVARLLNVATRQEDAERVIERFEKGTLPPLSLLLFKDSKTTEGDVAVASQVVAWLLSEKATAFEELRAKVLEGGRWSEEVGVARGSSKEMLDADFANDTWATWLRKRKWVVLTPGMTHPALMRRVHQVLVLPPPGAEDPLVVEGLAISEEVLRRIPDAAYDPEKGLTPEGLIAGRHEAWAPHVAAAFAGRIQRVAAGHSEALLSLANAYTAFFQAVMERKPEAELRALLQAAEGGEGEGQGLGGARDAPR